MVRLTIILVSFLLLLACDPGLWYQPVNWERRGDGAWEYANEDLHLALVPLVQLAGSTSLPLGPDIENRTEETVAIDAVTLVSGTDRYEGQLAAWASSLIAPREKRHVAYYFEFDEPIAKIFSRRVTLTFDYRIGGAESKSFSVLLERAR